RANLRLVTATPVGGQLQAKSRHLHLGSLGRYVRLGEQTSAQVRVVVISGREFSLSRDGLRWIAYGAGYERR
ncbi:MAG: hypothetical protein ACRDOH_27040, partial [Streptosporangiaceae bacterium]